MWARQGVLQPFHGALLQNAIQAYACGADLITYFQFRTFRFGAEQLEAAVMDIDGIPRRRFKEFQQISRDLKQLAGLLEQSSIENEIAICYDIDCHWAIKIKSFSQAYSYQGQIMQISSALSELGYGVDMVSIGPEIRRYKLVILPTQIILSDDTKALLNDYVQSGGILGTNFLATPKDPCNTARRQCMPAGLTDLFGVRVAEG